MGKIKYQGYLTKTLASRLADINRKKWIKDLYNNQLNELLFPYLKNVEVALRLVSYSSHKDFAEQVLSIFSFLKYVGRPISWIIYSDGSHTEEDKTILERTFPFVKLRKPILAEDFDRFIKNPYLIPDKNLIKNFIFGEVGVSKKIFYYLNHDLEGTTIFLDSDILFYECAADALNITLQDKRDGWFLPEWQWGTLDPAYLKNHSPLMYQVNSGFFILNQALNPQGGIDFLKSLDGKINYFSEQTTFHIMFMTLGFFPLDPRSFWLNNSDQFDISYNKLPQELAIRHYTSPVRHKMWQRNWKWHLGLNHK